MKISRKEYLREYGKLHFDDYRKSLNGLITTMYSSMRGNSRKRNMELPLYSKEEFRDWLLSQCNFNYIITEWEKDNYSKNLKPSVDRIDDYKGYEFYNIRLSTWIENKNKGHKDRRLGINNKRNTHVTQLDKFTNSIIAEYHSMMEAQRNTGILAGNIYNVIIGKSKTAGGFKWQR